MLSDQLNIRRNCLRVMRVMGMLIKKAAKAGLTLYSIANIVCRGIDLGTPSTLETLVHRAEVMCIREKLNKTCTSSISGGGIEDDEILVLDKELLRTSIDSVPRKLFLDDNKSLDDGLLFNDNEDNNMFEDDDVLSIDSYTIPPHMFARWSSHESSYDSSLDIHDLDDILSLSGGSYSEPSSVYDVKTSSELECC